MGVSRARVFGGALVVVLAVGSALSACGDPKPELPDPTPPSSSSASVSPSESATPQPESAEDFIRRWVEAHNRVQATGDVGPLLRLSRRCTACTDFARRVRSIYRDGGWIKTDGWTIRSISKVGARVFRVEIDSAPTTYVERAGAQTSTLGGGRVSERFELARAAESWVLADLSLFGGDANG